MNTTATHNDNVSQALWKLQQAAFAHNLGSFHRIIKSEPLSGTPEQLQSLEAHISTLVISLRRAQVLLDLLKGAKPAHDQLEEMRNDPLLQTFLESGIHTMPSRRSFSVEGDCVIVQANSTQPELDAYDHVGSHRDFIESAYALLETLLPGWPRPLIPRERVDPLAAVSYAETVMAGRTPELEPLILSTGDTAGSYSSFVLGKPWPEAEAMAAQCPDYARSYRSVANVNRAL